MQWQNMGLPASRWRRYIDCCGFDLLVIHKRWWLALAGLSKCSGDGDWFVVVALGIDLVAGSWFEVVRALGLRGYV